MKRPSGFREDGKALNQSRLCGSTARAAMDLAWCFTSISHPGEENTRGILRGFKGYLITDGYEPTAAC